MCQLNSMKLKFFMNAIKWTIALVGFVFSTGAVLAEAVASTSKLEYVGKQACVACHAQQVDLWRGSHHDLAMQPANKQTVLGDFNNSSFDYFGTVSTFHTKYNQFYVKTDGPNGTLTDYPIAYVFGVYPLQQYLIKFPKGRYQVLSIAWDSRGKAEGGQRWFHLYPDEHIRHDDELHWTGINQNWNFMCADCHSTNLRKNYDFDTKVYNTTWSEIDVSCEACHGPASRHFDWAKDQDSSVADKGLSVATNDIKDVEWRIDSKSGNAKPSHEIASNTEIEVCARCHSRRSAISADATPGHKFLDDYRPALLDESLYHADGQINEEVYVYGSFVQSKMYQAGVTCSHCHEPHSLKLRAQGNELCGQCHLAKKYDSGNHHLHEPDSEGTQCVACHMPTKTYMVVDPRRDHSFRIPRPDLSAKLGVPNACNQCHTDKSAQWAADQLEKKYGAPKQAHFAEALAAARQGAPNAGSMLSELILDETQPAMARATAVSLLGPYLSNDSVAVLEMAANDEDPLLGLAVASMLNSIPPQYRGQFAYPLLLKDERVTRMLAARALLDVPLENYPEDGLSKYRQGLDEFKAAQWLNADRPETLVNLADLADSEVKYQQAEQLYREAISIAPFFVPAYVNLAEHYRRLGDELKAEEALRDALLSVYDKTVIQHVLGLSLVRQGKRAQAMEYLRLAAESDTTVDRYVYVYGVALNSMGKPGQALAVLEEAAKEYPLNYDILAALVSINRQQGNHERVGYYESKLRVLTQ